MHDEMPGRSARSAPIAWAKAALRVLGVPDVADAIADLTDLGRGSIDAFVQSAQIAVSGRQSQEFTRVGQSDQEWAEGIAARAYIALASDPERRVMGESLIGATAVARLARGAMSPADRHELDTASDDSKAYVETLIEAVAALVSDWYVTNSEANRAAMAQIAGRTYDTVREIPERFALAEERILARLNDLNLGGGARVSDEARTDPGVITVTFELAYDFTPLASNDELNALVRTAAVGTVEGRPVQVEVSLPTIDSDLAFLQDPVYFAQYKRDRLARAARVASALTAFFSAQAETFWAPYLSGLPDRVTVARAVIAGQSTEGVKLDVWRTVPPLASAPIWLTPEEVAAVLESVGLSAMSELRYGAGWRDAANLPNSIIIEKVMPSVLYAVAVQKETANDGWLGDVLFLPYWHIGQG